MRTGLQTGGRVYSINELMEAWLTSTMSFNDKRGGEHDEHNMRPFPHQQNDSQRQKTPSKLSPVTSKK